MSELKRQLELLDTEEADLRTRRRMAISTAERTFEHLESSTQYGRERYRVVMADGTMLGYGYQQRPAAETHLRRAAQTYAGNVYLYDKRENVILDSDGKVVPL